MNNQNNPQDNVPQSGMQNEPQEIFLICGDLKETNKDYMLPEDNDFDSLEPEFVLWSPSDIDGMVTIKYVHHSEAEHLQSRIAELEAERNNTRAILWEMRSVMKNFDGKLLIETGSYFSNRIEQALKKDSDGK